MSTRSSRAKALYVKLGGAQCDSDEEGDLAIIRDFEVRVRALERRRLWQPGLTTLSAKIKKSQPTRTTSRTWRTDS